MLLPERGVRRWKHVRLRPLGQWQVADLLRPRPRELPVGDGLGDLQRRALAPVRHERATRAAATAVQDPSAAAVPAVPAAWRSVENLTFS